MKKSSLNLLLLASSLILAGCGGTAASSSSSSKISAVSSDVTSSSSDLASETSSPASSENSSSGSLGSSSGSIDPSISYGAFSIAHEEGVADPTYDETTSTYTFAVSSDKLVYTLKGYFKGHFVISNPNSVAKYKGVTIMLNGAYLASEDAGGSLFDFTLSSKVLTLKGAADTVNYLVSAGLAINSENNIEICGAGKIYLSSSSTHALKCSGSVRVYDDKGKMFFTKTGNMIFTTFG